MFFGQPRGELSAHTFEIESRLLLIPSNLCSGASVLDDAQAVHEYLFRGLAPDPGELRKPGTEVTDVTSPRCQSTAIDDLATRINRTRIFLQISNQVDEPTLLDQLAAIHGALIFLAPFPYGNEAVVRVLMSELCARVGATVCWDEESDPTVFESIDPAAMLRPGTDRSVGLRDAYSRCCRFKDG